MKMRPGHDYVLLLLLLVCLLVIGCGGGGTSPGGGSPGGSTTPPPPPPPPPPPTLTITDSPFLPNGLPGLPYLATVHATGGTGKLTWSVAAFSVMPQWLTLDPATGTLSGTPTSPEGRGFTLIVTDSGSPQQTATANYVLSVLQPLGINTNFLTTANRGIEYDNPIFAFGGTGAYTYTVSAGNLPPGLGLGNNGRVTGTPTQAGTFKFTVQVVDAGPPQQTMTSDVTLEVQSLLQIVQANLGVGIDGRTYTQNLQAVNGTAPLHWSVSGAPSGLAIAASTGTVSGSPVQDGNFTLHVTVSDSSATPQTAFIDLPFVVFGVLQITGSDLGTATVGQQNAFIVPFTGGQPTVSAQLVSTLPSGFFVSVVNTTVIAGGTQLGNYTFDLKLTDGATPPQTAQGTFTVHVVPTPPMINSQLLPRGIIGRTYSVGLGAQQGTPPYTWSINSGSLPDGLMLDSQGLIHGTPTTAGTSQFSVHLVDSGAPAQTANANFSIEVLAHALGRNDSIATATLLTGGFINASISPFSDPSTSGPDGDYYRLTANPGAAISVAVFAKRIGSPLDSVIEIVDGTGTRFTTCNDPVDQFLKPPAVPDSNPSDFNNPCINDDDPNTGTTDSTLQFKVPGTSGPAVTFYIHVIDFRGDARPDLTYQMQVLGAN